MIKRMLSLFAAIIALLISPYLIVPVFNDVKAHRFAQDWAKEIALPEETEIIEVLSGCGNTSGTGNHTEIWAGILLKSDLLPEKIDRFFRVEVFTVDENNTQTSAMHLVNKRFTHLDVAAEYGGLYIIEMMAGAVSSDFDMRGH